MALNINGTTGISGVDGSASAASIAGTDANTGLSFASDTVNINTGGATRVTVDSAGSVGIGTSTPTSSFSNADDLVIGDGSGNRGMTILAGTSGISGIEFSDGTGSDATKTAGGIRYYHSSDYMRFNTGGGTERMRIESGGNFLFQATSSGQVGIMMFRSTTSPYPRIMHGGSGGSFAGHTLLEFRSTVDGVIGEIKQDGDGTITYATSSDYRLKENIIDLTGAITRLKNLKPRRFNFKKNSSLTKDGFLAHELQEVIPEAVNGTKDEVVTEDSKANVPQLSEEEVGKPVYQTADLGRVVPLLTAALQEAIAKIEVLETKVAALEAG